MTATTCFRFASVLLFLLALLAPVCAQAPGIEWQSMRPQGEEFSILMPKDTIAETGKMPYHKMELNTRLYLVNNPDGPVLGVVSMSGIKSNPALYSEMERMNSYVDAFKKFFVAKVAPKETVVKLTYLNPKTLNGHAGREYQMTIGNRSGTAQVFSTRRRFYAVVFLTNTKADSLRDQFLSSFQLPDYVPPPPPSTITVNTKSPKTEKASAEEKPAEKTEANESQNEQQHADQKPTEAAESKTKTAEANASSGQGQKKPISGGVLNGKALSLPKPDYPEIARAAKAAGAVTVKVVVDEYGTVVSAEAASGHPLLQQSAVVAAYQARFSQTLLMGEPVKVTGVIVYTFALQ